MSEGTQEFGIDDGDESLLPAPRKPRRRPGKHHRQKINRRRALRTEELLKKTEGRVRGGEVLSYEEGVPCVLVRIDELLALVEWIREALGIIDNQKQNQRELIRRFKDRIALGDKGANSEPRSQ